MTRVVVTGGSGKVGRACIEDLIAPRLSGLQCRQGAAAAAICPFVQADLADFGQAFEVSREVDDRLAGIDAVVHLAAIPAPGINANAVMFRVNNASALQRVRGGAAAGIRNIVWASSETVLGLPFDTPPPYVPVDEEYPGRPGDRLFAVEAARRGDGGAVLPLGSRAEDHRPAVLERHGARGLRAVPGLRRDARLRNWNLWGYIDARDAAQAVRKRWRRHQRGRVFIIANADSVMTPPNGELMTDVFPACRQEGFGATRRCLRLKGPAPAGL